MYLLNWYNRFFNWLLDWNRVFSNYYLFLNNRLFNDRNRLRYGNMDRLRNRNGER